MQRMYGGAASTQVDSGSQKSPEESLKQEIDTIPALRQHEDKKENNLLSEETQRALSSAVLLPLISHETRIPASGLRSKSPQ